MSALLWKNAEGVNYPVGYWDRLLSSISAILGQALKWIMTVAKPDPRTAMLHAEIIHEYEVAHAQ